jgi:signal peptidase I
MEHDIDSTLPLTTVTRARRRPWIAVLLSVLVSGLGHAYAGQWRRGALAWILSITLGLLGFFVVIVLPAPGAMIVLTLLLVGTPLVVAGDAWRVARVADPHYQLRAYNRWYVYAAALLLSAFVVEPIFKRVLDTSVAGAFRLPSDSMSPTYQAGDYLLVSPLRRVPRRNEVVVYNAPGGRFVKRVVGVPGDTIAMRKATLVLNGQVVPEPYESHEAYDPATGEFEWQRRFLVPGIAPASYRPSLHSWGPLVIPFGQYFILGDNRNNSLDSRYIGFVPRDSITARPIIIYFSWDSASRAVRWQRLGIVR